ncbi:hypothetical protein [Microbacterium sp. No. 7]|uniref:hypothetical protein n=1 Tax=Microbacterium sp. No. 7 TaxID=1714373 RepID=UPI0006D020F0|nr:hypothetical protein [Microbacterium sp. No. 7]ALJ19527.1 hypothetical protein AOA12_06235 [Microbacterium sp. No. 7]
MSVHELNTDALPLRGTIAWFGWYVGGTGWEEIPDVRLVQHPHAPQSFAFIPKHKRLPREFSGGELYFRPRDTKN